MERIKQSQDTNAKILLNRITENPSIAQKLKNAFEVYLAWNMAESFDFAQLNTENLVNAYLNQEIKKVEKEYPKARHYLSFLARKMKENKKGIVFELVDIAPSWCSTNYFVFFLITLILLLLCLLIYINRFSFKGIISVISIVGVLTVKKEVYQIKNLIRYDAPIINRNIKRNINHNFNFLSRNVFQKIIILVFLIFMPTFFCTRNIYIYKIYQPYSRLFISIFNIFLILVSIFATILFYIYLILIYLNIKISSIYVIIPFLVVFIVVTAMGSLVMFIHFILRFLLFLETKIPLRYRTFLNKVSGTPDIKDKKGNIIKKGIEGTGILEKDGGQWRFRHQLLQDALASSS